MTAAEDGCYAHGAMTPLEQFLTVFKSFSDAIIDSALDAQRSVAADRQVVLAAEVAPGLPEVPVDEDRVQMVFANLLTNAIRHSPPGAPVTTRAAATDGVVRIEVSDEPPLGDAVRAYVRDVESRTFPGEAESTRMDEGVLDDALGRSPLDRPAMEIATGIPLDRDL